MKVWWGEILHFLVGNSKCISFGGRGGVVGNITKGHLDFSLKKTECTECMCHIVITIMHEDDADEDDDDEGDHEDDDDEDEEDGYLHYTLVSGGGEGQNRSLNRLNTIQ